MNNGYVCLHRKIMDNDLWFLDPFTRAQAWVDLFLNANWKDNEMIIRGNIIPIKRGQLGWSELTMAKRWRWSRGKVRRFLSYLEKKENIVQQKGHLTTIITICNYEDYQPDTEKEVQQMEQQTVQQTDNRRTTDGTRLNKVKKDKKEKNKTGFINKPCSPTANDVGEKQQPEPPFKRIIDYLNAKIGSHYKPSSAKNKALISARFNEGFTVENFKMVIDKKVAEWGGDEKFCKFLRPETLFSNKFESYLNQPEVAKVLPGWSDAAQETYRNSRELKEELFGGGRDGTARLR